MTYHRASASPSSVSPSPRSSSPETSSPRSSRPGPSRPAHASSPSWKQASSRHASFASASSLQAFFACVLALTLGACSGTIGDSPTAPAGPGPTTPVELDDDCTLVTPEVPLRRLTSEELEHTLEDLLGSETYGAVEDVVQRFPGESIGGGDLEGFQEAHVENHAIAMLDIGDAIASALLANPSGFGRLATGQTSGDHSCMSDPDDDCLRAFVAAAGERIHRRPLGDEDLARYVEAHGAAPGRNGLRLMFMEMFSSPALLFHLELDGEEAEEEGAEILVLDDWAVASRLSYRMWRSMPSVALMDAARAGQLHTPEQIAAAADEMMDDPRIRESVWRFFEQWLELDEPLSVDDDPALLDGLERNGLDDALYEDVRSYVDALFWDKDGSLSDLFTSAIVTTSDPRVASIYDVDPWDGEGTYPETGSERGGLPLRAAMLQSTTLATSPIVRGVFVLRRYLCDQLPTPSIDVVNSRLTELEHLDRETMRAREIVDAMTGEQPCATCHDTINPVAFALEDFDGMGRHRSTEHAISGGMILASFPVEPARSTFELDPGQFVSVDNGAELVQAMAESRRLQDCFVQRLLVHTQGRDFSGKDGCAIRRLGSAAEEGQSLRDLFLGTVINHAIGTRALVLEENR